jgi:hypothetical protein
VDGSIYGVKDDPIGDNEVTGEGRHKVKGAEQFTCVELEVF